MYVTIRRVGSYHVERIYLPFLTWSGVEDMRTYYRSRGFEIAEVKDGSVCF